MSDHTPDAEALARFLSGTASDAESDRVRAWLESDRSARPKLEAVGSPPPDVEAELSRLTGRIDLRARPVRRAAPVRTLWTGPVRAAAAIFALTLVSAILVWSAAERDSESPDLLTYETAPGERMKLRLPDGSEVELNVGSRLEVAYGFGSDTRTVFLDGEAYFDVVTDSSRPFVVDASAASVRVLGTAFNVEAYKDAPNVTVVVTEGHVAMRTDVEASSRVVLKTGDEGSVRLNEGRDGTIRVRRIDPALSTAWRRGELIFAGETLDDVAATLSRWYDVDVVLTDYTLSSMRLDARFQNEPLEDVLQSIGGALGVEYSIGGRSVTISADDE